MLLLHIASSRVSIGADRPISSVDYSSTTSIAPSRSRPRPRPRPSDDVLAQETCSRCARCSFRFTQRHARAQAKLLPFPAKKTTAGMPRRASVTGDRRSRIHRQVAMYHYPHRTAQCPFSRSSRYPVSKSGHREVHGWCTFATIAFADDAGVRDRTLRQMAMMNVGVIGCQPILQNKERKLP